MIVAVVLEHRFLRSADGQVWTQAAFAHSFWKRYLDVFSGVRVVARVNDVELPPAGYVRADGAQVEFAAVPYYVGPWQYLKRSWSVRRAVQAAIGPSDAVVLRVGSQLANCLFPRLLREQRPYGVEVVGDPWEVFAPGTLRHPLRPFLRHYFTHQLRAQCLNAQAAAYVTKRQLQHRYPVAAGQLFTSYSSVELNEQAFTPIAFAISDVELPESGFRGQPANRCPLDRPFQLIFVGSLEQLYKGPDVLLEALALLTRRGVNLHLTIVGDGQYRPGLEKQASDLRISQRVTFRGQIAAGEAVRQELDKADLFVLPSRTEGLPRALIEAQARGLPCIGSTAGGIPELLDDEDLVPPGDAAALARKIREVLFDAPRCQQMALRNQQRARQFQEATLRDRRRAFFRLIHDRTQQWLDA